MTAHTTILKLILEQVLVADEEEVHIQDRQLALRPADMSFEQAMLHYMAQMNDRQVLDSGQALHIMCCSLC